MLIGTLFAPVDVSINSMCAQLGGAGSLSLRLCLLICRKPKLENQYIVLPALDGGVRKRDGSRISAFLLFNASGYIKALKTIICFCEVDAFGLYLT